MYLHLKHPKLRSEFELINFDDETGLWWTEKWQLWTVYLKGLRTKFNVYKKKEIIDLPRGGH